eukprot:129012-Chlamydomonas_euryale.AAC.4
MSLPCALVDAAATGTKRSFSLAEPLRMSSILIVLMSACGSPMLPPALGRRGSAPGGAAQVGGRVRLQLPQDRARGVGPCRSGRCRVLGGAF